MFIGNSQIYQFFETALKKDSLSHAYGFVGPEAVGKKALANEIAAKILKTSTAKLLNHPDYFLLNRIEDEKTGKLKKFITIEQARSLKGSLQNSVWGGGKRVVVIDDAELLNAESGNALLKILEEPPSNTIFFLIIKNESFLLSTIKSRVQMIYFSLVPKKIIEEEILKLGVDTEVAKTAARRSLGRPGRAINLMGEARESYEGIYKIFSQLSGAPFYEKLKLIEGLYGDKEDGERGREAWQGILDLWSAWTRDSILKKHGSARFASEPGVFSAVNYSDQELINILDGFQRVKTLLRENVHPRLAVEELLLKIK